MHFIFVFFFLCWSRILTAVKYITYEPSQKPRVTWSVIFFQALQILRVFTIEFSLASSNLAISVALIVFWVY